MSDGVAECEQWSFLDEDGSILDGYRDGATFDPDIDTERLNKQMRRVWDAMRDGRWRTLAEIAECTGDPEASISARLRDFRKPRFGQMAVNRRRRSDAGLYEYQLLRQVSK